MGHNKKAYREQALVKTNDGNQIATITNEAKRGRPATYETPDEMKVYIDRYFDYVQHTQLIPTVEGLTQFLDMTMEDLLYYQQKEEFFRVVKKAKERIIHDKMQLAYRNKINTTLFIFDAKNNHNYRDKVDVESDNKHSFSITLDKELADFSK